MRQGALCTLPQLTLQPSIQGHKVNREKVLTAKSTFTDQNIATSTQYIHQVQVQRINARFNTLLTCHFTLCTFSWLTTDSIPFTPIPHYIRSSATPLITFCDSNTEFCHIRTHQTGPSNSSIQHFHCISIQHPITDTHKTQTYTERMLCMETSLQEQVFE